MILKIAHKRTLGALNRNSDATVQFLEQKKKRTQVIQVLGQKIPKVELGQSTYLTEVPRLHQRSSPKCGTYPASK